MTFFDRKEEVLEVELTPYGRHCLSLGKLKPVYYSFFDDDVIYDSDCAGTSEKQKDSENRIKENTPRSHGQLVYKSIHDFVPFGRKEPDDLRYQNSFDRIYALNSKLGIADYYSDHAPAWEINVLKGEIHSVATIHSSSGYYGGPGPNYIIPQINITDPTYEKLAGSMNYRGEGCSIEGRTQPEPFFDEELREIVEYPDGTFVEVRRDFILLEILENNVTFQKENFEIELFEVVFVLTEKTLPLHLSELLFPLKFDGPRRLHEAEYADYYFNLDIDREIDERMLCKYKGTDTTDGLFSQRVFDCEPDIPPVESPYRTDVTGVGDICEDAE